MTGVTLKTGRRYVALGGHRCLVLRRDLGGQFLACHTINGHDILCWHTPDGVPARLDDAELDDYDRQFIIERPVVCWGADGGALDRAFWFLAGYYLAFIFWCVVTGVLQ